MFYKKTTFPEENEIAICTVKKILPNCIFATLDEYKDREGLIHISEISPGRIRNIRDFVREGKKIICKVLKTNKERNHIDLSLRRVNQFQRINKNQEYKQEQKSEKILEIAANQLKITLEEIYNRIGYKIIEKYGSLTSCFQETAQKGEVVLKDLKANTQLTEILTQLVQQKIKPKEVSISATLLLSSNKPNGIEIIKKALKETQDYSIKKNYQSKIIYISAPKYKLSITAQDYKIAEKEIAELANIAIEKIKPYGHGEFVRNEKRNT